MSSRKLSHFALVAALGTTLVTTTAVAQEVGADSSQTIEAPAAEAAPAEAAPEGELDADASEPEEESARDSRLHNHATGLGWHSVIFRTEDGDRYALHGPSVTYDYFVGRDKWGFDVRGSAYMPIFGRFDGSNNYQGELRSLYGDRHYGFDMLLQVAYRQPLTDELVLFFAGGAHFQSFRLDGEEFLPVELITFGVGGSVRVQWDFHPHMQVGAALALGLDFVDLIRHYNRAVLTGTLDGGLYFGVRF